MSRIGKLPINLDSKVQVLVKDGIVEVKGPKGTLTRKLHPLISVLVEENVVKVERKDDSKESRSLHGLFRTLVNNMVVGVSQGFTKILEVKGTGYKFALQGNKLVFSLGFSHPVEMELPKGFVAEVNKTGNELKISSSDKEMLGDFTAKIKKLRPVEPYKGKGIFFKGETIRRKAGKAAG